MWISLISTEQNHVNAMRFLLQNDVFSLLSIIYEIKIILTETQAWA